LTYYTILLEVCLCFGFVLAFLQKSRTDVIGITSDEDSVNDNGSVTSVVSETKSVIEEGELFHFFPVSPLFATNTVNCYEIL